MHNTGMEWWYSINEDWFKTTKQMDQKTHRWIFTTTSRKTTHSCFQQPILQKHPRYWINNLASIQHQNFLTVKQKVKTRHLYLNRHNVITAQLMRTTQNSCMNPGQLKIKKIWIWMEKNNNKFVPEVPFSKCS